jgi:hypothetical protein
VDNVSGRHRQHWHIYETKKQYQEGSAAAQKIKTGAM